MAAKAVPARAEVWSIGLLLTLYVIQAVPMGISAALPLSLQGRGASYTDLAKFSFAALPFTLKLFWAPIVDTTSFPGCGRRKSWLVPVQLACAAVMCGFAWLEWPSRWAGEFGGAIRIVPLTVFFIALYILMATQDIAVDGWALEMLPAHMKKHASTCNTIGQSFGFYTTNITFLLFNHTHDLSRSQTPILAFVSKINISLNAFLMFWGMVMGAITLYVAFFVTEAAAPAESSNAEAVRQGLAASYQSLQRMLSLAPVQQACLLLLLCRLPFGAVDAAGSLKILETGCEKEVLALLAPVAFPIGVATSYLTGRWINQRFSALRAFKYGYGCRLALGLIWLGIYKLAQWCNHKAPTPPPAIYGAVISGICLQTMVTEIMFVSQMAFFAQVSDTSMGGTYMTFFNTVANFGNKWPSFAALAMMDTPSLLTGDTFVDLVLLSTVLGIALAVPTGTRLLTAIETHRITDWHIRQADALAVDHTLPSSGLREEAVELINQTRFETDEGGGSNSLCPRPSRAQP